MSLLGFNFLLFLMLFLLCYYLLPKKIQPYITIIFSVFFLLYNSFNYYVIFEILLILISSYVGGLLIEKFKGNKKSLLFCLLSTFIILGELIILKYSNFFIVTVNYLFNTNINYVNYVFPIGISYFSLIMISYLIDVYRDTIKAEKNVLKLSLFMSYFPLLTSGPFIRYDEYGNKLFEKHNFDITRFFSGCFRILWGFFKVIVISNKLNIFVNSVYGSLNEFNGILVLITSLLYTFELYTNFSGCIDIVLGVSSMIGVDLPENFNNPFSSKSISELWRRWHITLGAWLKDYIFYPLLKSKFIQNMISFLKKHFNKKISKKIPTYLAMLILWVLIGLWHAGEYKYIISSGLLQFIYIVMEELLEPYFKKYRDNNSKIYSIFQMIRTYVLFSFSMIFFRAIDVQNALDIIKGIFNFSNVNNFALITLSLLDYIVMFIGCLLILVFDNYKTVIFEKYNKLKFEYKLIILLFLFLVIILFGTYGIGFDHNAFIYGKF